MAEMIGGTAENEQETKGASARYTYSIVSKVAYLLGVPRRIFENEHESPKMKEYELLEKNRHARIVRNLCMLRTAIERNFAAINERMTFEYKSIMTVPDLVPSEAIMELHNDGIRIMKTNCKLVQYVIDINRLVTDRINNCRELFPLWIKDRKSVV